MTYYGKILWAVSSTVPNMPYLCLSWSDEDPDFTLVNLETGDFLTLFKKDIEHFLEMGRVRWEP